ncbi:DNA glycosylase, partial [Aaosphaeria arxii CBS 175.79]
PSPKKKAKRSRTDAVKEEPREDLPHNLGHVEDISVKQEAEEDTAPKRSSKVRKSKSLASPKKEAISEEGTPGTKAKAKSTKTKNNTYGLTPGQSPYPNYHHPTKAECQEVVRLLSSIHGKVTAPKTIPTPSLTVSGCGEVPSVLDALIRTRLSAATSNTNSSRAFAGLVSRFGILKNGVGKGSVDWNKVRLADTKEIFEAIKSGGLADVKSKDIKKILQMVWEENQARRDSLASESADNPDQPSVDKEAEISKANRDVISLDHLHQFSNDDAFNALTKYPGIGPKTASCVLLFCLQRPSFAVDTHVFRLSKWLGWVPPPGDPAGLPTGSKGTFSGPTRNSTYAHLDVMIPDDLKYPLHYLLIKHGKTCPRCRAITGENSEGWEKGCVIDHLVQRTGGRKEARPSTAKTKTSGERKAKRKRATAYDDDSDEISDISDFGSDEESDFIA